jgi:N-glycosylase/DNA lyase
MTCAPAVDDAAAMTRNTFAVESYDLAATLTSGQAFRWKRAGTSWLGVIGSRWVRLESDGPSIRAETVGAVPNWAWLSDYLQCDLSLTDVIRTFPADAPMRTATAACHGLRLLRQDPWECLASFILSSTKQIVQIQQIVALLCEAFGDPVPTPPEYASAHQFPSPARLAEASEVELRACKMGFRAPYIRATAQKIASGEVQLELLGQLPVDKAREELMALPGVGRKIADCVLLFAYGFQSAFPVDVWVMRALRELYFSGRRVKQQRLHRFSDQHFGPNAGYAQQYLFHYVRTKAGKGIQTSPRT